MMLFTTAAPWVGSLVFPVQLVSLVTLLATVFVLFIAYRYLQRAEPPPTGGKPLPGPPSWPLLGSLPTIISYTRKHGHRAFAEMAKEHGAVFGLRLFPPGQLLVLLSSKETVKEAFVQQASRMTDRYLQGLVKVSFPVQGSLAWENGDIRAARRRFILGAFRTLGYSQSGILAQRIQDEAHALCLAIDKQYSGSSSSPPLPFDPESLLNYATSNLFCATALGRRYEYDDASLHALVRNSKVVLDNLSSISLGNTFPSLYRTPVCREYRAAVTALTAFIQEQVDQHKSSYNANKPRDVVDLYLSEVYRQQEETKDTEIRFYEDDIWRSMLDVLIAGSFATATHLLWTLLFMTQYPDVQNRIHSEIDTAIGRERALSLDDRPLLPLTQATLFEVQRYRIATVSVPHLASEDTVVDGFLIPRGAQVLANFWSIHHDPAGWKDPDRFDPDRFLSEDGSKVTLPDNFIPFGVGPRTCVGEKFAKHQSLLIFATVMQRYTVSIPAGDPAPDMEGAAYGPALHPPYFKICVVPRT